jgi:[acyl-carrier-protein] S-malonyltransferase
VESVEALARLGVSEAIELGPGKVLAGMVKRIDKSIRCQAIEDPATLQKFLSA